MVALRSRLLVPLALVGAFAAFVSAQSGGGSGSGGSGGMGQGGAGGPGGSGGAATQGAGTGAAAQGGAPAMVPAMASALTNLQGELNALNSMNDAAASHLDKATSRAKLMTGFLASKNLNDAFAAFQKTWTAQSAPLSFQQAYQQALRTEALAGPVTPSTTDIDTLTNEVAATTPMVQQAWNKLNAQLRRNQAMSAFIDSQKLMNDYHDYAAKNAAAMKAEADARAKQQQTMEQQRDAASTARKKAVLEHLQKQWDSESHLANSGVNMNYSFSQGYSNASAFSQTPGNAYIAGSGQTPAPLAPAPTPTAYDYWTGTYFNGYADPYYDVGGWPGGVAPGADAAAAYRRSNGANAAIANRGGR